jgi:hypothetical protein
MSIRRHALSALSVVSLAGISACAGVDAPSSDEEDVVVRTETPEEWAQYLADVSFAKSYTARCKPSSTRKRVLVTGFGRFMSNTTNASGEIVAKLVPGLTYPMTEPPPAGQVDDPAPQTAVALGTLKLPHAGEVDVCGMVLPVAWDLSAILALKEIESFRPDMVMMNGIAGSTQPIWLELGSVNRAMSAPDGSGTLEAAVEGSPLVKSAPASETRRGLRLSWSAVRAAADEAIDAHHADVVNGQAFGDVLTGTAYAGFPRESNTYLCNNLTFVVGYLMDHRNVGVKLLSPSQKKKGAPTGVTVRLTHDESKVPRVFVHWPSSLSDGHLDIAADVMASMIDAQLDASAHGDLPTRGDNSMADLPADL